MTGMRPHDIERLTRVFGERAGALVLYARQWLDAASADDAVQEALVALLGQRRPPDNPMAWIYRAVRNAAIDQMRSTSRRRRREQTVAFERRELFESGAETRIDAAVAEEWLERLGPELREVVVLRIWGDVTFGEIALIMDLGVSTVHDRYKAALGQLRSALEQPCKAKKN
jgi:RNA polymerase sigma factor (sigma-70 family)